MNLFGDVELRHLVALRAVAETRSFGKAAEALGFTQSAVSQQIAALERSVGEVLFDRPGGPKPVSLTRAGELLLAHAEAILDRLRAAQADLAGYRAGLMGRISVGTFQSISVKILPEVLRRLRVERPDLDVQLHESDEQSELFTSLAAGDLDLTFCVMANPDADLPAGDYEMVTLAADPFVVLSPKGEPLAPKNKKVPAEALNGVQLIGQTPNSCQMLIEGGLRNIGVDPDIVFRTGDNSAVQAMVRSGMGHAVMPLLAIDATDPSIDVRDIVPPVPPRIIGVAVPSRRHSSPAVAAFIDVARAVCMESMPGLAAAS